MQAVHEVRAGDVAKGHGGTRQSFDRAGIAKYRSLGTGEGQLRLGLGNLFAVAEAYPELKTSETFLQLQSRISGLENAIADRREFYNESVNINNVRIEQFPDNVVASAFMFKPFRLLEFEAAQKSDVDVKQLFA